MTALQNCGESTQFLYSILWAMNKIGHSCTLVFWGGNAMFSSRDVSPVQTYNTVQLLYTVGFPINSQISIVLSIVYITIPVYKNYFVSKSINCTKTGKCLWGSFRRFKRRTTVEVYYRRRQLKLLCI